MSVSKNNFQHKNKFGAAGERYTCSILKEKEIECVINRDMDRRYDYDIIACLGEDCFTIEAKYDMMSQFTKNIAIEYHNSKKNSPSGIFVTKADFWAIILPMKGEKQLWMAPTKAVIDFLLHNDPVKIIHAGGDDNADLFLYKKDVILPAVFTYINDLTKKQLYDYLTASTSSTDDKT